MPLYFSFEPRFPMPFQRWLLAFLRATVLIVAAYSAAYAEEAAAQQPLIKLESAAFLISGSELPPVHGDWQTVALPDAWPLSRYESGDNGWYRFEIRLAETPRQNWGIYLPRLTMNAAVYLNEFYQGDGGRFGEPMARNWNHPLYFTIPPEHWKVGKNILYIRVKSYRGYGWLHPVTIGPETELRPIYNLHTFVQNDLNSALLIGTLFSALFFFGIWLRRREDNMYLWYALMALTWTLYTSNTVIRHIPVSTKVWEWLIFSCIAWWTVLLAIFSHRAARIVRPRLEYAFFVWAGLSTMAYALTDLRFFGQTTVIWQVGSIMIGFIVAWELLADPRRERHTMLLGGSIALVLLTGIHDWLLQSKFISHWWSYGNLILPFSAPLLILYIGWHLIGRFIKAMNEAEELNVTLEGRVEAAQAELKKTYAGQRELEVKQAALIERERIYRDLHDDVGAKLLGLAISAQRANLPKEADLARSALQDLRDVVSRSAQAATPLGDLLADWRAETGQRVQAAGLQLDWRFPEQETDSPVSPEAALNLSRILREAVTNVLRHAQAGHIRIATRIDGAHFCFSVEDDGIGMNAGDLKPHRGMTGMQARAALLNATLDWEAVQPHGCRVKFRVPVSSLTP